MNFASKLNTDKKTENNACEDIALQINLIRKIKDFWTIFLDI